METVLHDPVPEALERGAEQVREGAREVGREGAGGRRRGRAAQAARRARGLGRLRARDRGGARAARAEARAVRAAVARSAATDAVLATNTSSIPVTSLASAAARPENVVGMHFFNPAPADAAARGDRRRPDRRARARAWPAEAGEAMGKRVILAADGPGFLVNRCGRPFYTEALRLLQERVATPRADRPDLPAGRRLPHGAVRADGPGRDRHRLRGGEVLHRAVVRRAALAARTRSRRGWWRPAATGGSPAAATTTTRASPTGPRTRSRPSPAGATAARW